ncbi:hypothetical protein K432DRAFT_288135 [Lepidopterella palustris CBS 459.81]|uniref:DUF2423 domain-containing protein n=1 Tax=Lepidopterella palustris CBS 459.81 TaxID=1314670 RepID=A0A8E2JJK7_9PEZI|nr:hypothetical protein K432DRAFT_288135 [Lepidopterella palustris CBS 459.81]
MAKSLRASTKKTNRSKLRARVFAPAENARTERLSAKLLKLASQPRPAKTAEMELDSEDAAKSDVQQDAPQDQQAEGLSPCISWSISPSLYPRDTDATPQKLEHEREEELFFTLLGLSSDIVGFDARGDLLLAFDR